MILEDFHEQTYTNEFIPVASSPIKEFYVEKEFKKFINLFLLSAVAKDHIITFFSGDEDSSMTLNHFFVDRVGLLFDKTTGRILLSLWDEHRQFLDILMDQHYFSIYNYKYSVEFIGLEENKHSKLVIEKVDTLLTKTLIRNACIEVTVLKESKLIDFLPETPDIRFISPRGIAILNGEEGDIMYRYYKSIISLIDIKDQPLFTTFKEAKITEEYKKVTDELSLKVLPIIIFKKMHVLAYILSVLNEISTKLATVSGIKGINEYEFSPKKRYFLYSKNGLSDDIVDRVYNSSIEPYLLLDKEEKMKAFPDFYDSYLNEISSEIEQSILSTSKMNNTFEFIKYSYLNTISIRKYTDYGKIDDKLNTYFKYIDKDPKSNMLENTGAKIFPERGYSEIGITDDSILKETMNWAKSILILNSINASTSPAVIKEIGNPIFKNIYYREGQSNIVIENKLGYTELLYGPKQQQTPFQYSVKGKLGTSKVIPRRLIESSLKSTFYNVPEFISFALFFSKLGSLPMNDALTLFELMRNEMNHSIVSHILKIIKIGKDKEKKRKEEKNPKSK